jgi:lipopolysaccharide export system permease protein
MKLPRIDSLDRYVLRRFLTIYGANLVCFNLLFVLIDGMTHLDDFTADRTGPDAVAAFARYYAAITPLVFCQILGPVVSVCAALFCVTTLQQSNEFTPIIACGRSYQRTLFPVLVASLAVSGVIFVIQELWIPKTVSSIRAAHESRQGTGRRTHVKFIDRMHGNLILFAAYDRFKLEADGVDVIPVLRGAGAPLFMRADKARWIPSAEEGTAGGYWELSDGAIWQYGDDGLLVVPECGGPNDDTPGRWWQDFQTHRLKSSLGPADLEHKADEAAYMALADLRRKADASPERSGWEMKYFSRFAYPITNFVLVLLGLPVIVFYGNRNTFFGALLAVAICTCYFVANSICQDLGIQRVLPVRVGSVLAPLLFTSLGATLYRNIRS